MRVVTMARAPHDSHSFYPCLRHPIYPIHFISSVTLLLGLVFHAGVFYWPGAIDHVLCVLREHCLIAPVVGSKVPGFHEAWQGTDGGVANAGRRAAREHVTPEFVRVSPFSRIVELVDEGPEDWNRASDDRHGCFSRPPDDELADLV
jgi:hypothetical protein